ncbi:hypothetical protein MMC14_006121, partial [Varicellaria rhodocarpa]|nr:hypothetical protein [Varicellaria rhodocarpa]
MERDLSRSRENWEESKKRSRLIPKDSLKQHDHDQVRNSTRLQPRTTSQSSTKPDKIQRNGSNISNDNVLDIPETPYRGT